MDTILLKFKLIFLLKYLIKFNNTLNDTNEYKTLFSIKLKILILWNVFNKIQNT